MPNSTQKYSHLGQRVQQAKAYAGIRSDAELADRVRKLLPEEHRAKVDQRHMQRLKTSETSAYTPAIAEACGVRAVWLAHGIGPMTLPTALPAEQRNILGAYERLSTEWRDLLVSALELATGRQIRGTKRPVVREALAAGGKTRRARPR